jgi:hypothetical protein
MYRCRKTNWELPVGTAVVGLTKTLSLRLLRSATNALFGAVSADALLVIQRLAVPVNVLVVQPAGSAGTVTLSKLSVINPILLPTWKE